MSTLLLTNESPLQLLPQLALALESSDAAIVLQQIHYWLTKCGKAVEDSPGLWIYNRLVDWQKQFPWLSMWKLRCTLSSLRDAGIVVFKQHKVQKYNRTGWYTIDYEKLQEFLEPFKISICDIFTRRGEDSTHVELRNAHMSVDTVENITETISSLEPETEKKEEKLSDLIPDWDKVAEQASLWEQEQISKLNVDLEHANTHRQVSRTNESSLGLDDRPAAPPTPVSKIPKLRTTKQLEKEAWEIAPNHPYPVFLNWRADKKYKPQGGKWAEDAYGNAYSEFYNNRQKTTAVLFPEFLEYLKTVSGNCNEQLSADMKALLPSCFVMRPDATEENVQQLMRNIYQLASKGVTVALPQGIATPSCNQSMSFEQAQNRAIAPLKELGNLVDLPPQIQTIIGYLESGNESAARAIALRHNIDCADLNHLQVRLNGS